MSPALMQEAMWIVANLCAEENTIVERLYTHTPSIIELLHRVLRCRVEPPLMVIRECLYALSNLYCGSKMQIHVLNHSGVVMLILLCVVAAKREPSTLLICITLLEKLFRKLGNDEEDRMHALKEFARADGLTIINKIFSNSSSSSSSSGGGGGSNGGGGSYHYGRMFAKQLRRERCFEVWKKTVATHLDTPQFREMVGWQEVGIPDVSGYDDSGEDDSGDDLGHEHDGEGGNNDDDDDLNDNVFRDDDDENDGDDDDDDNNGDGDDDDDDDDGDGNGGWNDDDDDDDDYDDYDDGSDGVSDRGDDDNGDSDNISNNSNENDDNINDVDE